MMPIESPFAPRTVTRNAGSRLWMISHEVSMHSETNPRAMTVLGTKRSPPAADTLALGFAGTLTRDGPVTPCVSYRILTSIDETVGVRCGSRLCENSRVQFARRKFFSIWSI
jgi:hypothetical protein